MIIVRKAQQRPLDESDEAIIVVSILGKLTFGDARFLDGYDGWSLESAVPQWNGPPKVTYGKISFGKDVKVNVYIRGSTVTVVLTHDLGVAFTGALERSKGNTPLNVKLKPPLDREGFVGVVKPVMAWVDAAIRDFEESEGGIAWQSILRGGE